MTPILLAQALDIMPQALMAQAADVDKLAQGGVNYALAWGLAVAITGGGWLGKKLMDSFDSRLAEAKAHAEALAEVRTQGALLSEKMADALKTLDDVMRHLTKE